MKYAFFLMVFSITASSAENNVYSPHHNAYQEALYEPHEDEDMDHLIAEFIESSRIRHQIEATFDAIMERFGGNIKDVRGPMAEEMERMGMSDAEAGARLRSMDDFARKLDAAKQPLLSKTLEELIHFYKVNFTMEELKKLIRIFKDPTMVKFQQESLTIMPKIMEEMHAQAMKIVKPHIEEMQAQMQGIDAHYGAKLRQTPQNAYQGESD